MRSKTWYEKDKPSHTPEELSWKERMEQVLLEHPYYGYLRVTAELKRRGFTVNKKRIQRLMRLFRLNRKRRKKRPKTTDSNHRFPVFPNLIKNIVPAHPDHIWVGDITYIRLAKGFCYLAVLIDVLLKK